LKKSAQRDVKIREKTAKNVRHIAIALWEIVIAKQISDEKGTTSKTFNVGYTC
jgi:hypothetical protein